MAATTFIFRPKTRRGHFRRGPPISHTPRRTPFVPRQHISTAMIDMWRASQTGDVEALRALLKRDPDLVHAENETGWRPLHFASRHGHGLIMGELLDAGADVNAKNQEGNTALHEAAYQGFGPVVEMLVEHGANPNVKNKDESTGLHLAATHARKDAVRALVRLGTNPHSRDFRGKSAADLARDFGHSSIADFLVALPAPVSPQEEPPQDADAAASSGDENRFSDPSSDPGAESDQKSDAGENTASTAQKSPEQASESVGEETNSSQQQQEGDSGDERELSANMNDSMFMRDDEEFEAKHDDTTRESEAESELNTTTNSLTTPNISHTAQPQQKASLNISISPRSRAADDGSAANGDSSSPIRRPKLAFFSPGEAPSPDSSFTYSEFSPPPQNPNFSFCDASDAPTGDTFHSSRAQSTGGDSSSSPLLAPPDYTQEFENRRGTRLSFSMMDDPNASNFTTDHENFDTSFLLSSPDVSPQTSPNKRVSKSSSLRSPFASSNLNRKPLGAPLSGRRRLTAQAKTPSGYVQYLFPDTPESQLSSDDVNVSSVQKPSIPGKLGVLGERDVNLPLDVRQRAARDNGKAMLSDIENDPILSNIPLTAQRFSMPNHFSDHPSWPLGKNQMGSPGGMRSSKRLDSSDDAAAVLAQRMGSLSLADELNMSHLQYNGPRRDDSDQDDASSRMNDSIASSQATVSSIEVEASDSDTEMADADPRPVERDLAGMRRRRVTSDASDSGDENNADAKPRSDSRVERKGGDRARAAAPAPARPSRARPQASSRCRRLLSNILSDLLMLIFIVALTGFMFVYAPMLAPLCEEALGPAVSAAQEWVQEMQEKYSA